jgi:phosphoribosyl 1,2-cyclic phosphodiesterase
MNGGSGTVIVNHSDTGKPLWTADCVGCGSQLVLNCKPVFSISYTIISVKFILFKKSLGIRYRTKNYICLK